MKKLSKFLRKLHDEVLSISEIDNPDAEQYINSLLIVKKMFDNANVYTATDRQTQLFSDRIPEEDPIISIKIIDGKPQSEISHDVGLGFVWDEIDIDDLIKLIEEEEYEV